PDAFEDGCEKVGFPSCQSPSPAAGWRLPGRRDGPGVSGLVILSELATHELAVEREGLEHDVEPLAVFVREHEAEIEPEVVLALAPDDRVHAVRRLLCVFVRHGNSPLMSGCDLLRGQATGRAAWRLPARIAAQEMAGST